MTWSTVSNVSTTFLEASDEQSDYVVIAYEGNDYITGVGVWSETSAVSTVWT